MSDGDYDTMHHEGRTDVALEPCDTCLITGQRRIRQTPASVTQQTNIPLDHVFPEYTMKRRCSIHPCGSRQLATKR